MDKTSVSTFKIRRGIIVMLLASILCFTGMNFAMGCRDCCDALFAWCLNCGWDMAYCSYYWTYCIEEICGYGNMEIGECPFYPFPPCSAR